VGWAGLGWANETAGILPELGDFGQITLGYPTLKTTNNTGGKTSVGHPRTLLGT